MSNTVEGVNRRHKECGEHVEVRNTATQKGARMGETLVYCLDCCQWVVTEKKHANQMNRHRAEAPWHSGMNASQSDWKTADNYNKPKGFGKVDPMWEKPMSFGRKGGVIIED